MISMMINTSMTSINGVMFISSITSGSAELLPEPIFMPIDCSFFEKSADSADLYFTPPART